LLANTNKTKNSLIDKAIQYVLMELFRNVFLEKIIMEIKFPTNPIAIVMTCAVLIPNVNEAEDIFKLY
jgi:hypothetical protein